MTRVLVVSIVLAAIVGSLHADEPGARFPNRVSPDGRFLLAGDGKPFFYLGDTAWELFHRLKREEVDRYLSNRAAKRFTVIQAVTLAELDGHVAPKAYGHLPLIDLDPTRPAVKDGPWNDYWDNVDHVVSRANHLGLVVGLLPTWVGTFRPTTKIERSR